MEYEPVIGLEVHVELSTQSKVFCGCPTRFGGEPNTQVCPVCLGLPGVLPVLNEKVVEYAIKTALVLNCEILPTCRFDRKNYYYPDLPKNYQISQQYMPFCRNGWLDFPLKGKTHRIGIANVHIEEDAGKNLHPEDTGLEDASLVDFNRTGVPLLEIVSEPDLHSLEETEGYMATLREILLSIEVSNCKMEEGSLRFESNISMRPKGSKDLENRVEMKNLNSFRMVLEALEYEMERQRGLLEEGKVVSQETRLWDEVKAITLPMRGKEVAPDYRYFPEPDLPSLHIQPEWIEEVRRSLPELPASRRQRFIKEYDLPEYDAKILTTRRSLSNFFEGCVKLFPEPKLVSNWVMGDLLRELKRRGLDVNDSPLTPSHLAEMLKLLKDGTISGRMAKEVLLEMFDSGKGAREIVRERGLHQITGEKELSKVIEKVIVENPRSAADYRGGKEKALTFLVGEVMRETKGKANPQIVNRLLTDMLREG